MCNYEEVIEQDVKTTLREHFGFGEHSIEQLWKLVGESICEEAYQAISDRLASEAELYENIIGDTEL